MGVSMVRPLPGQLALPLASPPPPKPSRDRLVAALRMYESDKPWTDKLARINARSVRYCIPLLPEWEQAAWLERFAGELERADALG